MSQAVDKAMLIDDSEIDLFIHQRFLELCNFSRELATYCSAESALDWLKNLKGNPAPDIIFLDLNMPVIDGFSFLNHFSTLPDNVTDHSRIVVLTTSSSPTDREKVFLHKNVIGMITKPMQRADIDSLKGKAWRKALSSGALLHRRYPQFDPCFQQTKRKVAIAQHFIVK